MLGGKDYDSAELREELDERGKPGDSQPSNRKPPFCFSKCRSRFAAASKVIQQVEGFRIIATR
jgi:hypothetical protein